MSEQLSNFFSLSVYKQTWQKPNNAHDAPICQRDIEFFFYKNLKVNLKAKLSIVNMVSF